MSEGGEVLCKGQGSIFILNVWGWGRGGPGHCWVSRLFIAYLGIQFYVVLFLYGHLRLLVSLGSLHVLCHQPPSWWIKFGEPLCLMMGWLVIQWKSLGWPVSAPTFLLLLLLLFFFFLNPFLTFLSLFGPLMISWRSPFLIPLPFRQIRARSDSFIPRWTLNQQIGSHGRTAFQDVILYCWD